MFSFEPAYILYALIIFAGIIYAKNRKNILISIAAAFIALNLVNLDMINKYYATEFVALFIYEVATTFISFIVLSLTYNFARMSKDGILTVVEIIVSFALIYVYIFTGNLILGH